VTREMLVSALWIDAGIEYGMMTGENGYERRNQTSFK
jgi:hypothetical protein